jgi:predicted nucleic acid-binding protein
MKCYWDSSALLETIFDQTLEARLATDGGFTRTHTLSEIFSALTGGNLAFRQPANDAAKTVRAMVGKLEFVNLTESEILNALDNAQARGVRGGRVHDYLHALAADKAKADKLLTSDENDFDGLIPGQSIEQV